MKHWKHTVALLLALCLIGSGTALAQDEWQLCSPEEVDVSGVQEINGRLWARSLCRRAQGISA